MNERSARDQLLDLANGYVDAHAREYNPTDPGLFWGNALCDVLGGADYLEFRQVTTGAGEVICVSPVFGEPVHSPQFTAEQLGSVVEAAGEIQEAAPGSPERVVPGSEDWILNFAVQAGAAQAHGPGDLRGAPPTLAEALSIAAFWLLNTSRGLLDLTGTLRAPRFSSAPTDARVDGVEPDDSPVM